MLISVIIPNYNHAPFLKERIESVLGQSWKNFELIIIDDCSADNSREIIDGYRDNPKISSIIYNKTNSGSPFTQWKKGMEQARGELVWIAESDDFCEAEFLDTAVKAFEKDRRCVLWFCASDKADTEGKLHGLHPFQKGIRSCCIDGKHFAKRYMSRRNSLVNASSAVFRKDAALKIDNGYEKMGGCGDYMFWAGMMQLGDVCFDEKIMNHFRFHGANTTERINKTLKGLKESITTNRKLYEMGIRSFFRYQNFRLSFLYLLKYRSKDKNAQGVRELVRIISPGLVTYAALYVKRLKHLLFND